MKQHTEHYHRHTKSTRSTFIDNRQLKGISKNSASFLLFSHLSSILYPALRSHYVSMYYYYYYYWVHMEFGLFIGFTFVVEINKIFYFVCNCFLSTFRFSNFDLSKSKISTLIHPKFFMTTQNVLWLPVGL